MIRSTKHPVNGTVTPDGREFTTDHYRQLLRLAKSGYSFSPYRNIPLGSRFVLWRHDCDLSLNRSLRLALIEVEEGVRATYFVNPHCDFYNPLEKEQAVLIEKILALGHDLGLHFDGAFYGTTTESHLEEQLGYESSLLERFFGVRPGAFSFHNPTELFLTFEEASYGGLINCYSRHFKTSIPYCSDSNGYWRHRRLWDVLEERTAPCLQVLTHPGWWQERSMPPRERVFRCIDGRAVAVMRRYDGALEAHGRSNIGDLGEEFECLRNWLGRKAGELDYRWMRGDWLGVYVDLWRMFEERTVKFCRVWFCRELRAPRAESAAAMASDTLRLPLHLVLPAIYRESWPEISGSSAADFLSWQHVRNKIVSGRCSYPKRRLEEGIAFLVRVIRQLLRIDEKQLIGDRSSRGGSLVKAPRARIAHGACIAWLREHEAELQISEEMLAGFAAELAGGENAAR